MQHSCSHSQQQQQDTTPSNGARIIDFPYTPGERTNHTTPEPAPRGCALPAQGLFRLMAPPEPEGEQVLPPVPKKSLPPVNDCLATQKAVIWSANPFQAYPEAASNAQSEACRWKENQVDEKSFEMSYTHETRNGFTVIRVLSERDMESMEAARANVLAQVSQMTDTDGDTFLALIVQLCNGMREKDGWVWISAANILDYRGVKPITQKTASGKEYGKSHRLEDIQAIATCIRRMEYTRVTVSQTIYEEPQPGSRRTKKRGDSTCEKKGTDSKPRKKEKRARTYLFTRESPLFLFGESISRQELWGYDPPMGRGGKVEVAWKIKESPWMEPFIQGTNRTTVILLQSCLEYDPYHQQWEKRLARYLMFHLAMNKSNPTLKRKVGNLMHALSLEADERYPQRVRDRFEAALKRVKRDGHCADWRYVEEPLLKPRHWLADWKAWTVEFIPPVPLESRMVESCKGGTQ